MKLIKKIQMSSEMKLLTGLRIGDSKDNVEIGGVDLPVVRRKDNNQPYIPGSSIKGKLRSLLALAMGEEVNAKGATTFDFDNYTEKGKVIAHLFGSSGNNGTPSRIIVRDAYLTEESQKLLGDSDFTDMPYTEVKFENTIDRIKGVTINGGIRQVERIPAGVSFNVNMILNIYDSQKNMETDFKTKLKQAITLLENDYLGGSGSRGYGQVSFSPLKAKEISVSNEEDLVITEGEEKEI